MDRVIFPSSVVSSPLGVSVNVHPIGKMVAIQLCMPVLACMNSVRVSWERSDIETIYKILGYL